MKKTNPFLDLIEDNSQIYVLDGAMGTELEYRGFDTSSLIWSAKVLLDHPQVVETIHKEYFNAGADIAITNTFRTTKYMFQKAGYDSDLSLSLLKKAVNIVLEVKKQFHEKKFVFGSIAPLEDCFRPDLTPNDEILFNFHSQTIQTMDDIDGIDIVLFETHNNIREIKALSTLIEKINHPTALSVTLDSKGNLLDGTSWSKLVKTIEDSKFTLFGLNCSAPTIITKGFENLAKVTKLDIPLIAYANIGLKDPITNQKNDNITQKTYIIEARKWVRSLGVKIVGGCCGSNPQVIANLSDEFKN
jgi:homocysteine S-methyltransferase